MTKPLEMIREIVQGDVGRCDAEQFAAFQKYAVDPYLAPILRYGKIDNVVVVARRDSEVIYWEDVEEGFNVSPLSPDGQVLQHWCNQDELGLALNAWIPGRSRPVTVGPAKPI